MIQWRAIFFLGTAFNEIVCALLNTIDSRKVSKYRRDKAPQISLIFTWFARVYGFRFNFRKILASVLKYKLSKLKAQNLSNTIYDTYNSWSDWLTFRTHNLNVIAIALIFLWVSAFQLILRITRWFQLFTITCQTLIVVPCSNWITELNFKPRSLFDIELKSLL